MKKNKLPNFVVLLILTAITALFWISFSVYSVFQKPAPNTVSEDMLQNINPQLDTRVISRIKQRINP